MELDVKSWPIIAWLLTLVASAGAFALQTKRNTQNIQKIEHDLNRKLFRDDGESIYVPRKSCDECRVQCKFDRTEVYSELKETNKNIQQELKSINESFHELSGEVRQFMKTHLKE
jgi:hypothetical protein